MQDISVLGELVIVGKIALAMLLAGVVGYEREVKQHPAGLRTHMLVGGAAALFVILGELVTARLLLSFNPDVLESDPIRVIQAVMVGVSFLVAGTILQKSKDGEVLGLTTAASILFVSGIGVTVAVEKFVMATGLTVLALIVLHLVRRFEEKLGI